MQIILTLIAQSSHESLPLLRAQVRLEPLGRQYLTCVLDEVFLILVVLARWYQRALVTSVIVDQVALKVYRALCEALEALLFEKLPHLLLGDLVALLDQLALITVQ